jgi:phosphoribosylformimino-5-aminoimidazole carboxamide ribotide isomerase
MARHWLDAGCRRLHLVDLDGAVAGTPRNAEIIRRIVDAAADVPVQVGGGIRELSTIENYLAAGVSEVIVGTRAVQDPPFLSDACGRFPQRIFLGLDARGDRIATHGWETASERSLVEFAVWAAALPLAGIVYTDIARDGMLTGLNVESTIALAERVGVPVVASGGVGSLADLDVLRAAVRRSAVRRRARSRVRATAARFLIVSSSGSSTCEMPRAARSGSAASRNSRLRSCG